MKSILTAILAITLIGAATAADAQKDSDRLKELEDRITQLEKQAGPDTLQASWKNGLRLENADKSIRLQIGGRVQNDWAFLSGDDELEEQVGELKDGTKFRRARLNISGTLYDTGIFKAEYDFAGGSTAFRDVWVGVQKIPHLGTIRVGNMLEPYSLEQLSGNNYHQFIERGLPAAFYPFRSGGVTVNNSVFDKLGTWSVGAYQRVSSFGDFTTNSKYAATTRITASPVYSEDGSTWMHVGFSYSHRKPDADTYSVASRPESYIAPNFVNTGGIPSDRVNLAGWELAATHGPMTLQGEYHMASVDLVETEEFPHTGDADLSGYYVYASYFLTGEHRVYSRDTGTFGRTIPRSNFRGEGHGWGAWEVGVRHSELDLDDGPVEGGRLRDWTFGINWYLNPNMRVMWNYIYADLADAGQADIFTMRAQVDF